MMNSGWNQAFVTSSFLYQSINQRIMCIIKCCWIKWTNTYEHDMLQLENVYLSV